MRLRVWPFLAGVGLALAVACSGGAATVVPPEDAGALSVCGASLDAVFAKSQCPADSSGYPVTYDTAITTTCGAQGLTHGDIRYGQCLDYLVWEQDNDSSGNDFSKCFYDVTTHALVGIVYGDGTKDECGGHSLTVQAGAAEAYCAISGLSAGGGGNYEPCGSAPEAGAAAAVESGVDAAGQPTRDAPAD